MSVLSVATSEAIGLAELSADPYPIYAKLREKSPVCFVPAANRYLVTRHADIVQLERSPDVFSANEAQSLMKRAMGHNMLRKDGAQHKRERVACEAALRPNVIRSHWLPVFQRIVDELIDQMLERGDRADLFDSFAAPCAGRALGALLGLSNVSWQDLATWSQAMMDGTGNYADDADIWRRSDQASAGVDAALQEMIPYLQAHPDQSLISAMLHAADPLSHEEIAANVKVIIGGGLNEPRDAIGTAVAALLQNPDQRAQVEADPTLWRNVFEEAVRWVSPIGMYPRQTTREVELGGTLIEAGARIGVVLASGNRDEAVFDNAANFDINRAKNPHVAFGGGAHFCLGTWAARVQVGEVALPTLFRRLAGLQAGDGPVTWAGWVFRGPTSIPIRWTKQPGSNG